MNMSGLFTARDAKLFHETEENGIIFQKVTNIGIFPKTKKAQTNIFVYASFLCIA